MANLLYICPNSSLQSDCISVELASAMMSCSHRVRMLTTYSPDNEDFEPPKKLEYLMPFKRWSLLEIPKVFLSAQGFTPDVVHFFLNSNEADASRALLMSMPSYFKSLYGSKLVLHLEESIPKRSMVFSQWMHEADLVITKDHYQLLKASALFESTPGQLLMTLNSEVSSVLPSRSSFAWMKEWFNDYIYVAGSVRSSDEAIAVIKSCEYLLKSKGKTGIVMNIESMQGGLASETILHAFLQDNFFEKKVCLLRSVTPEQNRELAYGCSHFFIAHLGVELTQMTLALDSFLQSHQVAICTHQQAYFIQGSTRKPMKLQECKLGRPILDELSEVYETEGIFQPQALPSLDPVNRLNRAYQQILS
ncbi:MAG: hypothetical protein AAF202_02100 [Pseudomonadota bacterium]